MEEKLYDYNIHVDDDKNVQNMSSDQENFEDTQAILSDDINVFNGFDKWNKEPQNVPDENLSLIHI